MQMLWLLALIVALPIAISICAYLYRRKSQQLPEIRIPATEKLAIQAARSHARADKTVRMQVADKEFIELLREYKVDIPPDDARMCALDSAFFMIDG